jgi:hypothetical protein
MARESSDGKTASGCRESHLTATQLANGEGAIRRQDIERMSRESHLTATQLANGEGAIRRQDSEQMSRELSLGDTGSG